MYRAPKASSQAMSYLPYLGLGVLNVVYLIGSWLRELQDFWTNAGGYPVVLRELVQFGYYPLLGTALFLHLVLGVCHRGYLPAFLNVFVSIPLGLGLVIAWSNNVINLWMGRPLHWHP